MNFRVFLQQLMLAFTLALGLAVDTAHAEAPPLEAYGALPAVEDAVISPSGERIAMLGTFSGNRVLVVADKDMKTVKSFGVGDLKIRGFRFVSEDLVMLRRSVTQDLGAGFAQDKAEVFQAYLFPLDGGNPEQVFSDRQNLLKATFGYYGMRLIEGRPHAFFGAIELKTKVGSRLEYEFDHGRPALYAVDLIDNSSEKIFTSPPPGKDRDWLVGEDGRALVTLDSKSDSGEWVLYSGGKTLAEGVSRTGGAWLIAIGRDGSSVIYATRNDETAVVEWYEVPVDGSSAPVEVYADEQIDEIYEERFTGRMIGFLEDYGSQEPVFFDPDKATKAKNIKQAFAGLDSRIIDWTPDFSEVLVRTRGNGDSGSYFKVDLAAGQAKAVGYERPEVAAVHVGPISTVQYSASDGLALDGILTLPPGKDAKNLPLIMLPHGGPHDHDKEEFDWWAQAFASRGYAVFQPNFRGSTNRDEAFVQAGYGQWGRKMQTDISDGMNALAEKGIIDPTRACIVGASYGGYAALAGVTIQQDLYRCAVSVNGVSDVSLKARLNRRDSGYSRVTVRATDLLLGPSSGYDEISPRKLATRADAPILLIHGREDTVVAFEHSSKMADALEDAGKPYEFIKLKGEDHWLSQADTRKAMLEAAVSFVEKHNPPD